MIVFCKLPFIYTTTVFVDFESVISAVECAVACQENFLEYNKGKNEDEVITIRAGVHLGDIIEKDNDVFGDGVNIASRIQSMAEPGGINISESVYQQVHNKLDLPYLSQIGRAHV